MRISLLGLSAALLTLGAAAASAEPITEKQLAGRSICWPGHGVGRYHRNHSYEWFDSGLNRTFRGTWSLDNGIVITNSGIGSNNFTLDVEGSQLQGTTTRGSWSGSFCGGA